jgi:apolipoprotein N-acyltransferase
MEWLWRQSSLCWSSLALTQSPGNLVVLHLSQLSGPETVTAALILINCLLSEAFLQRMSEKSDSNTKRLILSLSDKHQNPYCSVTGYPFQTSSQFKNRRYYLFIAGSLFTIIHLVGWFLYSLPLVQPENTSLKIGIIQGNILPLVHYSTEGPRHGLETYTQGYQELAQEGADAVLTPEGAFPFTWKKLNETRDPLRYILLRRFYQAIHENHVPIWIGTRAKRDGGRTQSLLEISDNGKVISRYDKVKLLPLWEYIPFDSVIGALIKNIPVFSTPLLSGQSNQQVNTSFGKAIVGICNDSAFTQLFRAQARLGGKFIITASDDSMFNAVMMTQHYSQDLMRAIETDRWAVRATSTGISGFIDPHGNPHIKSKVGAYETYIFKIYRRTTQTLYVQWGNWFTPLLLVIGISLDFIHTYPKRNVKAQAYRKNR